jgi:hypothetical protein
MFSDWLLVGLLAICDGRSLCATGGDCLFGQMVLIYGGHSIFGYNFLLCMPLPNGEIIMGSGHLSSFVEVMPSVIWNSKQICRGLIFCLQDFRNVEDLFPRPSDSSASSAVFGLAAPMRLVRFSPSSLELDRSEWWDND